MHVTPDDPVLVELIRIVSEQTGLSLRDVIPSKRLREDLEVDSLTLHALLIAIEERWQRMPSVEALQRVVTLADLYEEVREMLQEGT